MTLPRNHVAHNSPATCVVLKHPVGLVGHRCTRIPSPLAAACRVYLRGVAGMRRRVRSHDRRTQ